MSTTAIDHPQTRYGLRHVMRAELIKFRTLRSTAVTLVVTFLGALGVTALVTATAGNHDPGWYQGFDSTNQSLIGLVIGILSIGVLGIMVATGEYATGTIRSTLSAAPRRPLLLLAKTAVVGAVALVVGELLSFSCFFVGQAILTAGHAPAAALDQHGVLTAVTASGLFLGLLGLLGLGIGVFVRNTAGAISTYVGVTFLVPVLMSRLPDNPARYTPVPMLANSVTATMKQYGQVSVTQALFLMALYSAAVLVLAAAMIVRRDA
jgi:ABC-2 type transport system permease protein